MDPLHLFLDQHSIVHSAEVGQTGEWSMYDSVLKGLTEEQMRLSPGKGLNSIAWLVWHMARTEDVTMNLIVAGRPQMLDGDNWLDRLKLTRRDIGTSMTDDEVGDFSLRVDIPALLAYRNAVGRRTREIARTLRVEEIDERVDPARIEKLLSEGALAEGALRLAEFWGGQKKSLILNLPATGHNFMHLAEALTVRRLVIR